MTVSLSDFLARLRDIRVCLGYTQDTMAGQLGISRRTYIRRENGELSFRGEEELTTMVTLGEVTLDWLIHGHPMPLSAKDLGGRIRQARRNALLSVAGMAERLDTTEWQILEWETDEPVPMPKVVRIAAVLGVDPRTLNSNPSAPVQQLHPLADGYRPIHGKHLGIKESWASRVELPKGARTLELDSSMEPLFPTGSILIWKPEKPKEALRDGTFWVMQSGVPCLRRIVTVNGLVTFDALDPSFTKHQPLKNEDLLGRPLWILRPFPETP